MTLTYPNPAVHPVRTKTLRISGYCYLNPVFRSVGPHHPTLALPVRAQHLYRAFTLAGLHRDPFDRLLAAQAEIEALVLVTRDRTLQGYPIETVW